MFAELIHRKQLKSDMKTLLADAEVCPKRFVALYLGINLAINMVSSFVTAEGVLSTFLMIFTALLRTILGSGFVLYCMAVRRNERAEYLTLFDGFGFAGKIIALQIIIFAFTTLWSLLFLVPGVIAAYRYRFALYNLYENPDMSVVEALNRSKRQTRGYKGQLFTLDLTYVGWSLLASLPVNVEVFFMQQEMLATQFGMTPLLSGFTYSSIPSWGWVLLSGVWALVVSMFYLPVYQCTELGYFEIAKRTSGTENKPPLLSSDGNAE